MPTPDILVVGASAGGVEALIRFVRELPRRSPAAIFVVLHLPARSRSRLPEILSDAASMPVMHAEDRQPVRPGTIAVAIPNYHLVVQRDLVRVISGPRENGARPSIDVLFRSAAQAYGDRVAGVILSGTLADGAAGLEAIKKHGGIALVQDPKDAAFAGMPMSAIERVPVDYVLPASEIGKRLVQLLASRPLAAVESENGGVRQDEEPVVESGETESTPSAFACPDCGGVLWETRENGALRYRCRTGHGFSSEALAERQDDRLEETIWSAIRSFEEKADLNRRLAANARLRSFEAVAERFETNAEKAAANAAILRDAFYEARPSVRLRSSRNEGTVEH